MAHWEEFAGKISYILSFHIPSPERALRYSIRSGLIYHFSNNILDVLKLNKSLSGQSIIIEKLLSEVLNQDNIDGFIQKALDNKKTVAFAVSSKIAYNLMEDKGAFGEKSIDCRGITVRMYSSNDKNYLFFHK